MIINPFQNSVQVVSQALLTKKENHLRISLALAGQQQLKYASVCTEVIIHEHMKMEEEILQKPFRH
jgi:hypothetical protein